MSTAITPPIGKTILSIIVVINSGIVPEVFLSGFGMGIGID
jgi:hypothetical protein